MTYPRWWVRLATDALLSWRVVLAVFILGTLAYAVGNEDSIAVSPVLAFSGALAGNAVVVGTMALGRLLFRRVSSLGPAGLITLVSITAGAALRGGFIFWFHGVAGLVDEQTLVSRLFASVLSIAPLTVIAVSVVDALDDHRETTHRIKLLSSVKDSLQSFAEQHTNAFTRETINRVTVAITGVADTLSTTQALSRPDTIVDDLKRVTNEVVRPLSKELEVFREPLPEPPPPASLLARIDWRQIARDATTGTPYYPRITAVFMTVAISGGLFSGVNAARGALVALGGAVAIATALWAQNRAIGRFPKRLSTGKRLAAMVAMAMAANSVLFGMFLFAVGDAFSWTRVALNVLLGLPTIMVVLAIRQAAVTQFQAASTTLDTLRREVDWESARANDVFWHRRRTLATIIHGPVQANLNAAVLKLQQAIDTGTFSQETLDRIGVGLGEALAELDAVTDTTTDLQLALDRTKSTWEGLCEVTWDIDHSFIEALSNSPQSSAVADILIEATFNAVRHGGATAVHIAVTEPQQTDTGPHVLTLDVTNNGRAPAPNHSQGQGSQLFDMLTTSWSLDTDGLTGQTIFRANLPLEGKHGVGANG